MLLTMRTHDRKEKTLEVGPDQSSTEGEIPCFQCGVCCMKWQPLMDREETERIAKAMGISGRTFRRKYTRAYPPRRGWRIMRHGSIGCIFLGFEEGRAICTIHEFKPEACRSWTASLTKSECREGLEKMASGPVSLPGEVYSSEETLRDFIEVLVNRGGFRGSLPSKDRI